MFKPYFSSFIVLTTILLISAKRKYLYQSSGHRHINLAIKLTTPSTSTPEIFIYETNSLHKKRQPLLDEDSDIFPSAKSIKIPSKSSNHNKISNLLIFWDAFKAGKISLPGMKDALNMFDSINGLKQAEQFEKIIGDFIQDAKNHSQINLLPWDLSSAILNHELFNITSMNETGNDKKFFYVEDPEQEEAENGNSTVIGENGATLNLEPDVFDFVKKLENKNKQKITTTKIGLDLKRSNIRLYAKLHDDSNSTKLDIVDSTTKCEFYLKNSNCNPDARSKNIGFVEGGQNYDKDWLKHSPMHHNSRPTLYQHFVDSGVFPVYSQAHYPMHEFKRSRKFDLTEDFLKHHDYPTRFLTHSPSLRPGIDDYRHSGLSYVRKSRSLEQPSMFQPTRGPPINYQNQYNQHMVQLSKMYPTDSRSGFRYPMNPPNDKSIHFGQYQNYQFQPNPNMQHANLYQQPNMMTKKQNHFLPNYHYQNNIQRPLSTVRSIVSTIKKFVDNQRFVTPNSKPVVYTVSPAPYVSTTPQTENGPVKAMHYNHVVDKKHYFLLPIIDFVEDSRVTDWTKVPKEYQPIHKP